ncbi:glucose-6-phosphate dehydrogenase assembly protein OpcA [Solirubrobacter soli]|uniref:glucose-6-phosphate dehydrogenase assembly protein OpcA n=1 Tax=Solirubrobacter soli TaxID=363832 RepID=UPI00041E1EC2|nr:glucose-6-phosphate dehydrogenase assembly protein OpcA [Solirubrobacter soli]
MDDIWRDDDTTPGAIEAALRKLFAERHKQERAYVPARVMNMVVIVDKDFRGEVENRLQRVGRFHPSRLILVAVEPGRKRLSAVVRIGTDDDARSGAISVGRERVELQVGDRHLAKLDTIVDPLVVSDLTTMVWSPHRHMDAVDALRRLAQIVLIDSQDAPDVESALTRADSLSKDMYVVDLAWLRSTPWRERIAAAFDSPRRRPDLARISGVTVRHREDSLASGLLFCGWLASRLGWQPGALAEARGHWSGTAHTRRQDIKLHLEPVEMSAPGLAGVTIELASGAAMALDRSPGGLRAMRRDRDGTERTWTVMGASRGEGGILGEGVRQALLRDPTYRPALQSAEAMVI